ncbi:MAG: hypothetical protein NW220_02820 [Leptolyngbyaceae cyanobacterium bins.349]|nr:hypothetical protein [Leptolyngbyaceae cyanobacterium bins.349]
MKAEVVNKNRRSRAPGLLPLNVLQLSLLSPLLFNVGIALDRTTAKASEPTLAEPTSLSSQVASPPVLATDTPSLEPSFSAAPPAATVVPGAIANPNLLDQPLPSVEPVSVPIPVAEVDLPPSPVSKNASDLTGTSTPQINAPATLAQTENSAPADSAAAAKPVNNPLLPPPGWRFDFEPYLFLPLDVQGDIFFGRGRNLLFPNRPGGESGGILGNRGVNLNVNARLSDIRASITSLFGISGRFQAWNGNFGIVSEGLYVNTELRGSSDGGTLNFRDRFDVTIPGFEIDTRSTISSFALGASYRFLTVPFRTITDPADPRQYYPAISFEALAGFRYLSVFQSVDFERGPSFEVSGSEINPMIGGTAKLMLSDRFAFFFRGDTSNLGGGDIKQYYNLYAGVDWKFAGSFALRLAYRLNQIEFVREGRLEGENGFNLRSQGVQLGVSWQF